MKKRTRAKKKAKKETDAVKSKRCLDIWSLYIRVSAGCVCQSCGAHGTERKDGLKVKGLSAHHLISKRHLAYKFDIMNGVCLCDKCHGKSWGIHHKCTEESMLVFWRLPQNQIEWFMRRYNCIEYPHPKLDYDKIYAELSDLWTAQQFKKG